MTEEDRLRHRLTLAAKQLWDVASWLVGAERSLVVQWAKEAEEAADTSPLASEGDAVSFDIHGVAP